MPDDDGAEYDGAPMRRLSLIFLCLLVLSCSKNKAKVGDKCEVGGRACIDAQTGLYCAAGVYQLDTCRGPRGCVEEKGFATCDITGNNDGDPCPMALDGFSVCRADRKTRAMCKGGKYVVESCAGENGCTTEQVGVATCDKGNPVVDEACTADPRIQYCGVGKKTAVTCQFGKYKVAQACPGPLGCKEQGGGTVICDPLGTFKAGDPCYFIANACTEDHKLLSCKVGTFLADGDCPGEGRCNNGVCDRGYADDKSSCPVRGARACAKDHKALLECKEGKKPEESQTWQVSKKCKECVAKDGKLECP